MGLPITIKKSGTGSCPGDLLTLTAAIRDIALAYPGRFDFHVQTPSEAIWQHNPFVGGPRAGAKVLSANYPLVKRCNQEPTHPHFLWGFLEDLNNKLNVQAPLTELRPAIYLSAEEKAKPPLPGPYWVVISGGKKDFTAKWWAARRWQQVADALQGRRKLVQVGARSDVHPHLQGVHDLVGKTTLRELFRLVHHAEGVLCIVTCLTHIAAAFNKPCVVLAGGREAWWWEAYTNETRKTNLNRGRQSWTPVNDGYVDQLYLNTMNKLPCCMNKGCWRSSVKPVRHAPCHRQVQTDGVWLPECMAMIKAADVVQAMESYFPNGLKADTPALQTAPYEPPRPLVPASPPVHPRVPFSEPKLQALPPQIPSAEHAGEPVKSLAVVRELKELWTVPDDWAAYLAPGVEPFRPDWKDRLIEACAAYDAVGALRASVEGGNRVYSLSSEYFAVRRSALGEEKPATVEELSQVLRKRGARFGNAPAVFVLP